MKKSCELVLCVGGQACSVKAGDVGAEEDDGAQEHVLYRILNTRIVSYFYSILTMTEP